ncbi:hypothetical protein HPP92_013165 [Vanilla planifolia]|uniref:Nucleolus and neural progenitor protein-like N-terminal domain-containing protein n=1 Tax=Vanilla planifolia TaxID=51239 RepID=A0A835QRU5_VANPL|nr:hypothetical protein HPP92_013165 [Vanilla planifolia]
MESENRNLEERLKCTLIQLQTESGILERIIYKGRNQHRRCPYFQAILKVRRELRLLQLAEFGDILNGLFSIIKETSPVEFDHLPKLCNKSYLNGKHNYHDRLLGVARLLSQMVEPIIKAAIQISLLLAKTFFMGFSLTVLACLARLRVLVQQGLIDVVSVFNEYAALSQKHSVKLTLDGIESHVEYYCTSSIPTLKCVWEGDKFVLHECTRNEGTVIQEKHEPFPLETPIQYQTLEVFNQGSCIDDHEEKLEQSATISSDVEALHCERSPTKELVSEANLNGREVFLSSSTARGTQSESRKRVAFVAVQIPKSSETERGQTEKKTRLDFSSFTSNVAADDPYQEFISNGNLRRSLFEL